MTLPKYLLEAYENLPEVETINVLMRHSIRFPITSDAEVFTAQLTPEGEQLAANFGTWINKKYQIGKIITSPINRCIETGRYLAKGAGNHRIITPDPILSHPNENGEYDAFDNFFGTDKWPTRITRIAEKMFPTEPTQKMNFLVTHDTVLVLMAAYWLKIDIRASEDWPQYLEPIFFWSEGGNKVVNFRGNKFLLDEFNKN